jgi:hypothetical protein
VGKDFLIAVGSPFLQKIYQLLVESPYSLKALFRKGLRPVALQLAVKIFNKLFQKPP